MTVNKNNWITASEWEMLPICRVLDSQKAGRGAVSRIIRAIYLFVCK
jgi:hypothetical protein